ncbi:hypothetical protein CVT24_000568 [Panaeolus cyanescens]|uniref:Uncharacterized protein n=1 Tax=Panaeolus cyanescens TaxID=181874 RepID=A0A409W733_9AGAR|nr:hypothetical protein CVT24_000568 [Panaeolus cyanescens]
MASNTTQIDNYDPRVLYRGSWSRHPNGRAFNQTITLARAINTTATLVFTGNSVAVYGELGPYPPTAVPPVTKYEIDDGDPVIFAPPSPTKTLDRLLFFQSRAYPYDGDSSQTLSSSTIVPINPTITPSASRSSEIPPGTIAGAVLGGIAAGLAIAGIIFFILWRTKKLRFQQQDTSSADDLSSSEYTPFRRSAMLRDSEQAYNNPYEDMGRRESEVTANSRDDPTSRILLSGSGPEASFGLIPPMKMREEFRVVAGQPQGLPTYSR